jgi:hypothetical protein
MARHAQPSWWKKMISRNARPASVDCTGPASDFAVAQVRRRLEDPQWPQERASKRVAAPGTVYATSGVREPNTPQDPS